MLLQNLQFWEFVSNVYNTTLSFFFFILALVFFYIATKGMRAKNKYGAVSTAVCGGAFIIFGYYNSVFGFFPYPYSGFMVWWIGFNVALNLIFSYAVRRDIRLMRDEGVPLSKNRTRLINYILRMTRTDPYSKEISLRMEIIRKSFHISGLLVLVAFYGFFFIPPVTQLINDGLLTALPHIESGYNAIWGPLSLYPYTFGDPRAIIDLTMMALIGSLVFAITSDILRILWGPEYSIFNFITHSMIRPKEINAAGPQIYIIVGFIFSYMLYIPYTFGFIDIRAYFAGILIATLSDAAAALIGRGLGKHKVKCPNSIEKTKTVEGFVAGAVIAYIIGLIFVGPIYAIIGAVIFFITDYFPTYTADNILNPVFIPIGIQIFIYILGLPIGW